MVKFRLITVGKPPRGWREEAFSHYRKLIRPYALLTEVSVKEQKLTGATNIDFALAQEAKRILSQLDESAYRIALEKSGEERSSEQLAKHFEKLFQRYSSFDLMIGGPYGLHKSVLGASNEVVSLSQLTLPHDLARILVVEQIFRVLSILNNSSYHK